MHVSRRITPEEENKNISDEDYDFCNKLSHYAETTMRLRQIGHPKQESMLDLNSGEWSSEYAKSFYELVLDEAYKIKIAHDDDIKDEVVKHFKSYAFDICVEDITSQ